MRLVGRRGVADGKLLARFRRAKSRLATFGERDASEPVGGRSLVDFVLETGISPDEYVVNLLEERGGDLRQQEIIAETGLNRSSVSRLLREMEENGQIRRVRLGTENEVYLPDAVPDLVRPFDAASTTDI